MGLLSWGARWAGFRDASEPAQRDPAPHPAPHPARHAAPRPAPRAGWDPAPPPAPRAAPTTGRDPAPVDGALSTAPAPATAPTAPPLPSGPPDAAPPDPAEAATDHAHPAAPAAPPAAAPFPYAVADLPTDAPLVGELGGRVTPLLATVPTGLPGLRADAGLLHGRWIAAASAAGQSHLQHGSTPQDAYQFTVTDDGSALVVVVCDGLGSRPLTSQIGATLLATEICAAAAALTVRQLADEPETALRDVLSAASDAVVRHREAVLPGLGDSDLRCTVALCVLPRTGYGWAARVGDCNVFTLAGGEWGTVFEHEDGPVNRVSAALPHAAAGRLAECVPIEPMPDGLLILTTDGVAEDLFNSPGVRGWLTDRWSVPCGAARMADTLRYRCQGSHDDRTALVVWPATEGAG
jgi:hypothetical protein